MRRNYLSALALASILQGPVFAQDQASEFNPPASDPATGQEPSSSEPSQPLPAPAASPASATSQAGAQAAAAPAPTGHRIRFSFKGATFEQVIEFFSRVTGLPVIWQTPAPEGTLDYISPEEYDMAEALRVLNIILQSKGVMLRVSEDNLYLQKLDQMQRENVPTFIGTVPDQVASNEIVTVVRPLKIAMSKPLAEKLASMVATYGSVMAMEQQNSLVITETAANVRRILSIVEQLDQEDPEGAVEIFRIQHARATDLMTPLKALLSQKVEKFVINQQGQQVKIEEEQMQGLSIGADERTNAIIAKGAKNKLDKLRETIELLDVPGASGIGQGRSLTTMALARITPADAVAKLRQLYQSTPEKDRPSIIAMEDASKVMIIGSDAAVTEGTLLLRELEDGPISGSAEQAMVVVPLQHAAPASVINALTPLLSKRQAAAVRLVAGLDDHSLILAGPADDIDAVKALLPMLDQQSAGNRQVRVLRITSGDPQKIVEQARQIMLASHFQVDIASLFGQPQEQAPVHASRHSSADLQLNLDAESRTLTLIGKPAALDLFTATIRQLESSIITERETRRFDLANMPPSAMVNSLQAVAAQVLLPVDGAQYIPPQFAPIDQLNVLIATATPQQFDTLQSLIQTLDMAASASAGSVHVLTIDNADAAQIAMNLEALFNGPNQPQPRPTIRVDAGSNSLLVRASDAQLQTIQDVVSKIDRATIAASRQMRLITVDPARGDAGEIARTLQRMLQPDAGDGSRIEVITLEELLQRRQQAQSSNTPRMEESQ